MSVSPAAWEIRDREEWRGLSNIDGAIEVLHNVRQTLYDIIRPMFAWAVYNTIKIS